MPRSPTSSEDEMAQSCSDYSVDSASDSSREEIIYETIRATAEPTPRRMDDIHTHSLVVRVLIPDLQQTFRYKSRVYRQTHVEEKQIAKLHTKANLRKFMDLIQHHQVEKVSRLLERGLDPNYQDTETG
uniref:Uncharacterized protein n=1 Tax=Oncorhynchus tshawytscha TaxID=74940 RepID=A0A8C8GXI0_ONCTS